MYPEYKNLNLPEIDREILDFWEKENIFERSIEERDPLNSYVFYEGPPSANGLPGIHHVMARTIKDLFCRYQTLKGKRVERKGGWDTHGLPIELSVEKELGITKEDIGTKITVEEYNKACRETVMRYKNIWDDLTVKMGYWVDLENPYITYENEYIESVWWLLKQIYDKGLLYKGYTIQPYSPAAGTGLSSHELNMPGAYKEVTDTTVVAMFETQRDTAEWLYTLPVAPPADADEMTVLGSPDSEKVYILAWTTTPWTLPSNTALTVGSKIDYVKVRTHNPYTDEEVDVVIAEALIGKWFGGHNQPTVLAMSAPFKGDKLVDTRYSQLLDVEKPEEGDAFRVISGNFVTTQDGTGIVHTAPSFGADDMFVGKANGIGALTLVDKTGRFTEGAGEFAGRFVKDYKDEDGYVDVNVDIAVHLKKAGKAFNVSKYNHNYPHCWRTDKPVLYYPLDSWFIKASAVRERMSELNDTINWKPASTGEGRFGKWLENLQDWNLSRSRYWGIPLPIWRSKDGEEELCIGSIAELQAQIEIANKELKLDQSVPEDLHRPYIDDVVLWQNGQPLKRELDLIDVWFDSGSMPYAQWGFPPVPPMGGTPKHKFAAFDLADSKFRDFLTAEARKMRKDPTKAEATLWEELKGKKLGGYKFRRQHSIGRFIVDFVNIEKRLIIELDGGYHDDPVQKEYDAVRTGQLSFNGWKVIRFKNEKAIFNTEDVVEEIRKELFHRATLPKNLRSEGFSQFPPFGGGRGGAFPADFIAEGVDQTRGWFYTLHAIATMVFDSVAFKNVVSNGLVLDKNGNKMSKRLGNAADPFETLSKYGADATRWYMISNSDPWDNLKFDIAGIGEVQRKLFGTLYNTYNFFALYANIDNWVASKESGSSSSPSGRLGGDNLAEIDLWILSKLHSLLEEVQGHYSDYEPTKACRAIDSFVGDQLSNWYVRRSRRRFWKGDMTADKKAAYQTLHQCLVVVSQLMAPVAPFFSDWLYKNLHFRRWEHSSNADIRARGLEDREAGSETSSISVHLSLLPNADQEMIDKDLEQRMEYAQRISSLVLSLRKKAKLRVRQPLQKILLPVLDTDFQRRVEAVKEIILDEVNVKEIEYLTDDSFFSKQIKPNFKTLGRRLGKQMKTAASAISQMSQDDIAQLEKEGQYTLTLEGEAVELGLEDFEISTQDVPGWSVASESGVTVALDLTVTEELAREGLARELVNRIQNQRKDDGLEVTDRISLRLSASPAVVESVNTFQDYLQEEVLADKIEVVDSLEGTTIELVDEEVATISIEKL
ncbi:MAG: isoleucine--tRNA ligase [Bacteroidota bacterium]